MSQMCTGSILDGPAGISWSIVNFQRESDTCQSYSSKLWLVMWHGSGLCSQSCQHINCQADTSKWSSTCFIVGFFFFWCELCQWLKLSCLHSSGTPGPLTDRDSFCRLRQLSTLKICSLFRLLATLSWHMSGKHSSLSLSLLFAKQAWQLHSNKNA